MVGRISSYPVGVQEKLALTKSATPITRSLAAKERSVFAQEQSLPPGGAGMVAMDSFDPKIRNMSQTA
jgi:hypothetical protein